MLRFVNTVAGSKLDKKSIWSHIKILRFEYIKKYAHTICEKSFISDEFINIHFQKLSEVVGTNRSDIVDLNLSMDAINSGAKMFLTLNSCPSFMSKLYLKAIYGQKSKMVMIALNIIKKAKDDTNRCTNAYTL